MVPHEWTSTRGIDRGGVLTPAAFLAGSSRGDVTNPVVRGSQIWVAVLCGSLPPPPPGVDAEPLEAAPDKQATLAAHRESPSCAGCHDLIDPIGLGLEQYDAIGRLREVDEAGVAVPDGGQIAGIGPFGSGAQIGELVAASEQARRCLVNRYRRFAFGRAAQGSEQAALDEASAAMVSSGGTLAGRARELAVSDSFRFIVLDEQ